MTTSFTPDRIATIVFSCIVDDVATSSATFGSWIDNADLAVAIYGVSGEKTTEWFDALDDDDQTRDEVVSLVNGLIAIAAIEHSTDLDGLLAGLKAADDETVDLEADGVDIGKLPNFGGDEPVDTDGIWSWDDKRLLVDGSRSRNGASWAIVPR